MNKAEQMLFFLDNLIAKEEDFEYASDGNNGDILFHFKDGSILSIKQVRE
jgi:hypothetical protein